MDEHACRRPSRRLEDIERVFVGAALVPARLSRIAQMEHERQARDAGDFHLTAEHLALYVARRQVVIIVEAYFPEHRGLGARKQAEELRLKVVAAGNRLDAKRLRVGCRLLPRALDGASRGGEYIRQAPERFRAPQWKTLVGAAGVLGRIAHRADEIHPPDRAARQRERRVGQHIEMRMGIGDGAFERRPRHDAMPPAALLAEQRVAISQMPGLAFGIDRIGMRRRRAAGRVRTARRRCAGRGARIARFRRAGR